MQSNQARDIVVTAVGVGVVVVVVVVVVAVVDDDDSVVVVVAFRRDKTGFKTM